MTPDNQAGAGKSRRGPGRRPSRTGWRLLLFRVSRYFKDSTGGAAGKGFTEEIFKQADLKVKVNYISSDDYQTKAKRPKNSRLSKSELEKNGFKKLPSWQDALKRYLLELQ